VLARASTPSIGLTSVVAISIAALVGWTIGTSLTNTGLDQDPMASPVRSALPSGTMASTANAIASPIVPSASAASSAESRVVLELSGTGDLTSEPVTVEPGWQLQWQTDGPSFDVAIRGDTDLGTIVHQSGPVTGVNAPAQTGTFRIVVTAEGRWAITVLQEQD
jgi:hypothetical protein